jgi:hypothetical protein
MEELLQRIRDNDPTLLEASFYNQNIGDQGCIDFVTAMTNNTHLTCVGLGNNNIGDLGCQHLGELLKTNGSLESIYLHENNIGESGVLALQSGLNDNTNLKKIYLHGNNIEKTGPQFKRLEISIDKNAQNRVTGYKIHDGQTFFVFM